MTETVSFTNSVVSTVNEQFAALVSCDLSRRTSSLALSVMD